MSEAKDISLHNLDNFIIRPVRPDDKKHFIDGFKRSSAQTLRQRFLSTKKGLSEKELEFYSTPDGVDHLAYCIAEIKDGNTQKGVGVIRAFRDPQEPNSAEFAIIIVDDYQGKGFGSRLINHLIKECKKVGISELTGEVQGTNLPMIKLILKFKGFRLKPAGNGILKIRGKI